MCIANPPAAPPSGKGANDPTKRTKTQCKKCWREDYEKEISIDSYGRYFKKYLPLGIPHAYSFHKEYKIFVHLKALNTVIVKVRFKMNPQAGVSDADAKAAKITMTKGVKAHWNGKFNLVVDDPVCGKKTLKISYRVAWVTSGQHYSVNLLNTLPTEFVRGKTLFVSNSTDDWTYAHEFGHCVGLPDEYSYTIFTETVKYIKPDGSLDTGIIAIPKTDGGKTVGATIMSTGGITTVLKRHAWNIAIEVQELLRAKLGREVKCTIN
jgi:hypothetical protein